MHHQIILSSWFAPVTRPLLRSGWASSTLLVAVQQGHSSVRGSISDTNNKTKHACDTLSTCRRVHTCHLGSQGRCPVYQNWIVVEAFWHQCFEGRWDKLVRNARYMLAVSESSSPSVFSIVLCCLEAQGQCCVVQESLSRRWPES